MIKSILAAAWLMIAASTSTFSQETLSYGLYGQVTVYKNSPQPAQVVLFVSGDGGWNLGVVDMAKSLAGLDALVVGIDIVHYLSELAKSSEACLYPAADFENLSKFVQQYYGYSSYVSPILVGYSSGATLVYTALVQAPATAFKGAISLGFCPDLPLNKPMCRGSGLEFTAGPGGKGYSFLPCPSLEAPWIALQGTVDQVCESEKTKAFVGKTKNSKIVELPKVGHGFSVQKNWLPQFKQAFSSIVAAPSLTPPSPSAGEVGDLPLAEIFSPASTRPILAVHLTGDGGYGVTDKGICEELEKNGISTVALNSLKYFWKKRTPDEAAGDVERIIRHYLGVWKKDRLILIGYSMGADALPFIINRLPGELKSKIDLIVFLGLGATADFQFHFSSWLGKSGADALPVMPELEKLIGIKMLCVYGENDRDVPCKALSAGLVETEMLKGGHRIGGNFEPVAAKILSIIPQ